MRNLQDLELSALSCINNHGKKLINEAINCYNCGAFRAAIITTWIAVVFDLLDKIYELQLAGNLQAKAIFEKYENNIKQLEKGDKDAKKKQRFLRAKF
jgi:hypothetical protein